MKALAILRRLIPAIRGLEKKNFLHLHCYCLISREGFFLLYWPSVDDTSHSVTEKHEIQPQAKPEPNLSQPPANPEQTPSKPRPNPKLRVARGYSGLAQNCL